MRFRLKGVLNIVAILTLILTFTACPKKAAKRKPHKPSRRAAEQVRTPPPPVEIYTPQRKASDRIVEKGKVQLEAENYERALQLFQNAVNVDSANGVAYYYLALTNIKLEQEDIALGLLDKAEALLQHEPEWLKKVEDLRATISGVSSPKSSSFQRVEDF